MLDVFPFHSANQHANFSLQAVMNFRFVSGSLRSSLKWPNDPVGCGTPITARSLNKNAKALNAIRPTPKIGQSFGTPSISFIKRDHSFVYQRPGCDTRR